MNRRKSNACSLDIPILRFAFRCFGIGFTQIVMRSALSLLFSVALVIFCSAQTTSCLLISLAFFAPRDVSKASRGIFSGIISCVIAISYVLHQRVFRFEERDGNLGISRKKKPGSWSGVTFVYMCVPLHATTQASVCQWGRVQFCPPDSPSPDPALKFSTRIVLRKCVSFTRDFIRRTFVRCDPFCGTAPLG